MAVEQIASKTGLNPVSVASVLQGQQTTAPKARGKTAMSDAEKMAETPFMHFERLGLPRTESALNALRLLSNLAGKIYPTKDMAGWKQFQYVDEVTGKTIYYWTDTTSARVTNAYTMADLEFIFSTIATAYNQMKDTLQRTRVANVKAKLALPKQ